MSEFRKIHNDFNYVYQKRLEPNSKATCVIPTPTGKAKSVKAVYWQTNSVVTTTATLSANPNWGSSVWDPVRNGSQLSPAVTAIRFNVGPSDYGYVCIRVIME